LDDRLDAVVARDVGRVDRPHGGPSHGRIRGLLEEALPPPVGPGVEGGRIPEETPDARVPLLPRRVGEAAEGEGEVGDVRLHGAKQVPPQLPVAVALLEQPELAAEAGAVRSIEEGRVRGERVLRHGDRGVGVVGEKGEEALGQTGQVPPSDGRLLVVGIATLPVDGAEHRAGIVRVEKGAGPEIDGLPGDRGVVGVHHPVNESDQHPVGDQRRLARITASRSARYGRSATAASG
jgi:hypothetical protein